MNKFDLDKMLYTLTPDEHDVITVSKLLTAHPEVKFVSLTGVDLGNHNTDEKIPVRTFIEDMEKVLESGVQTDGSSVALPVIADLSNARVDIVPDMDVNWYVEYNWNNIDSKTGLPVGTLRIPSFLKHNGEDFVGSRAFLKRAVKRFGDELENIVRANPYVIEHIGGLDNVDDIEKLSLTNATELEFWVKTPDDRADRDQLFTSQELKEQYWKRTIGPVGTALEQTLEVLDHYGFGVEMGHKEVGGVRAKMGNSGQYDHIMEQLEVDWKYASPMQAADNESQVKHIVRDIFRYNGLEVTFLAKPVYGVAGNGEHTHFGVAAKLKDGRLINMFESSDRENEFMSPIGYGALMGILRNYEIMNPIVCPTHDAFQRLKPGFEAPVCIVTSLGKGHDTPSRNRTVLIGLVRDFDNPLSTRFELRSPNPHSNTYLIIGAGYNLMLDGIRACLEAGKTSADLEKSISKSYGEEDFYLEKNREYRCEKNVFTEFTPEEREMLFGKMPATVWENFKAFDIYKDRMDILTGGSAVDAKIIESFTAQMLLKWTTEYHDRRLSNQMDFLRGCKLRHDEEATDYDLENWKSVKELRDLLGKDSLEKMSLLSQAKKALDDGDLEKASDLELEIQTATEKLRKEYNRYIKNLF